MRLFNRINTLLAGGGLALALMALASTAAAEARTTDKPKSYPLEKCIVSGEKLGEMGKPYVFTYQGREIKFCCKGCLKDFNKEPAKYIKQLEAAEKARKPKPYLLKTCIVSGDRLDGDMGKPYVFTYKDREIKFCCKGCLKDFNKEPAKYIKQLEAAEKAAKHGQTSVAPASDPRGSQH